MSYDLAVWHATRPITTAEATEIYARLGEDDSDIAAHAGVARFLHDLTARYRQPGEGNDGVIDDCPWSSLDYSDRYVLMCLAFSRVDEVVPVIQQLAARHDLVCFIPQRPCVVYPPRLEAMPHLRLSLADGTVFDHPSPAQLAAAVGALDLDTNPFGILERTDTTYIQTGVQRPGEYVVEYRDGSPARHYQAVAVDAARVVSLFQAYAAGRDSWKREVAWHKIDLELD